MKKTKTQDAVLRMAYYAAQMYYHLTHEMVQDYGEGEAKRTILRAMHEFGLERGRNIRSAVEAAGEKPTIENLSRFYDMPIDEGWAPENSGKNQENQPVVYSKTEECIYADYWIQKNWREFGRLYCEVDPAIREGYNDKLVYSPDKNILDGDDCCDSKTSYREKEME